MATRLEKHHGRQNAVSLLGKELTRRAGSKCELCQASGVKLQPYEVEPIPEVPTADHCVFLCQECILQLNQPKAVVPNHWRCLSTAMWSEIPAVQLTSVLMLRRLQPLDWANELLEQLHVSDEVTQWLEQLQ